MAEPFTDLLSTPHHDLMAEAQHPARARHGNARHLLAEGFRSAHDALPGRLRVLHLRAAPSSRRAGVPERGRGPLDRARGGRGRVHRGALHARRSSPRARYSRRARGARARSAARRRSSISPAVRGLVLEETGLLPHLNPGVMSRDELVVKATTRSPRRWGSCSRRRPSASRRGVSPDWLRPTRCPRGGSSRTPPRGRASSIPFTSGILVGIGRRAQQRLEPLVALRELASEHGHLREVIVQIFRGETEQPHGPAPPRRPRSRSISGRSRSRGSCSDRTSTSSTAEPRRRALPAAAGCGDRRLGRCLAGHVLDHVNPEAPWPEVELLRAARQARGRSSPPPRLPPFTEDITNADDADRWPDPAPAPAIRRAADAHGLAREDRLGAGEPSTVPFVVGRETPGRSAAPWADAARQGSGSRPSPAHGVERERSLPPPMGYGARCAATR